MNKSLRLPDNLRAELAKPIGTLIPGSEEDLSQAVNVIKERIHPRGGVAPAAHLGGGIDLIVTVGDIVAQSFNENNLTMDMAIVDFIVKRQEKFKSLSEIGFQKKDPDVTVNNPKGMLTSQLSQAVEDAFNNSTMQQFNNKPYIIRVVGEEDLATLAVILAAPLNTYVYYGQPTEGIVEVIVNQEKKKEVENILEKFEEV